MFFAHLAVVMIAAVSFKLLGAQAAVDIAGPR